MTSQTLQHDDTSKLLETLAASSVYQEYEKAFTGATGLPVALRPVDSWQLPHHGRKNENSFCAMLAGKSKSCAACLCVQQTLATTAVSSSATVTCDFGMVDSAVPVRLGDKVIGFLQTGQVFQRRPSEAGFKRSLARIGEWGLSFDESKLRETYFGSRVVDQDQYSSTLRLLEFFARQISTLSNQLAIQQENAEAPVITKAKEYIEANCGEKLSLGEVAKAVHTSPFYFCKTFKKATGINFTEYVSRIRVEKAKNLLLNPNLRVSEVAFEIGFQSLTHFNRVFKKIVGDSPSEYREKLAGVCSRPLPKLVKRATTPESNAMAVAA